jgi:hypothetical protein
MNAEKTHWKILQNPDFIGAYWLPPGEDVTVTIDYVVREVITGTGGKKEECTVAHLQGVKPFILNATNCKTIAKLYGNYIEDWAGKQITLFGTTTKMGGETVECLRIRPKVAAVRTIPPITDVRLDKALESIGAGQFTVQQLREKFQLTPEQDAKVKEWEGVNV